MDKKYVLTNKKKDSFFKQWTGIGPMFTNKKEEAMVVQDKIDFAPYFSHFAMALYNVEELP